MQPGTCINVCAACGHRVIAEQPRVAPFIVHGTDCPRADWPVRDAILYDYGSPEAAPASVRDWGQLEAT